MLFPAAELSADAVCPVSEFFVVWKMVYRPALEIVNVGNVSFVTSNCRPVPSTRRHSNVLPVPKFLVIVMFAGKHVNCGVYSKPATNGGSTILNVSWYSLLQVIPFANAIRFVATSRTVFVPGAV